MLRTINQEILRETNINYLLIKFTPEQIAKVFNVGIEYVDKIRQQQRIETEINFKNKNFNDSDEMKLSIKGSWFNSKERRVMEENELLEKQQNKYYER